MPETLIALEETVWPQVREVKAALQVAAAAEATPQMAALRAAAALPLKDGAADGIAGLGAYAGGSKGVCRLLMSAEGAAELGKLPRRRRQTNDY